MVETVGIALAHSRGHARIRFEPSLSPFARIRLAQRPPDAGPRLVRFPLISSRCSKIKKAPLIAEPLLFSNMVDSNFGKSNPNRPHRKPLYNLSLMMSSYEHHVQGWIHFLRSEPSTYLPLCHSLDTPQQRNP